MMTEQDIYIVSHGNLPGIPAVAFSWIIFLAKTTNSDDFSASYYDYTFDISERPVIFQDVFPFFTRIPAELKRL